MVENPEPLVPTTRPLLPETVQTVLGLKPGERIRIRHVVRVGKEEWTAETTGTFREVRCLVTGLATDRRTFDDVVVPTIHFTKDNGELSSIALDEHTLVERITD